MNCRHCEKPEIEHRARLTEKAAMPPVQPIQAMNSYVSNDNALARAQIVAAYRAGATMAEVVRTHGLSRYRVRPILLRAGVEIRRGRPRRPRKAVT